MSWEATSWATKARVGDASLKLLLLMLSNYANEGGVSWHSQFRISFDTEIPVRSLRRKLAQLVELGFIEITPRKNQYGEKATSLIRLRMYDPPAKMADGYQRPNEQVDSGQIETAPEATKAADKESKLLKENNLLGERDPPAKKVPKIKTPIPDSFAITDEHLRFARERGFEQEQARFMFDKFKSHHQSKGSLMLRWDAAWRTWVLNQVGFAKKDGWRSPNDRGSAII